MTNIEWTDEHHVRAAIRQQISQQKELSNGLVAALVGACLSSASAVVLIFESFFDSILLSTGGLIGDAFPHLIATLLVIPVFVIFRSISIRIQYPEMWNKGMCPVDRGWLRVEWMEFGVFLTALPGILNNIGAFSTAFMVFILLNIVLPVERRAVLLSLSLSMVVLFWLSFGPAPEIALDKKQLKTVKSFVKDPITGPVYGALAGQICNVLFDKSIRRSTLVDEWLPERDKVVAVMISSALGVALYLGVRELFLMI